jgi:competence protein ComEC
MPRAGWLAVGAVLCGLTFGAVLQPSLPLTVPVLVASTVSAAVLVIRRRVGAAAMALGVACVAARLIAGDLGSAPGPASPGVATTGTWTGQVLTLGTTSGGQQRSLLVVRAAPAADMQPTVTGPWRTYAWLPRYPPLVPGDRIAFEGSLEPVRDDGSEFAGYLRSIDARLTVRVREVTLLDPDGGVLSAVEGIRRLADEALARVVPEPMAGLASAILVGRRDRVGREVSDAFTTTGLSHVVAISGWNIALIGAVVGSLLAMLGLGRRQRTFAIVAALAGFTLLAGGGASVVRAAVMGGVVLVARETGRPGSAAAALGVATWGLLVLDPAMATDIGFQLSVAATAGLLAWSGRITERLQGARPGRVRGWLAASLGVSLAAQAATLPLVLYHFGRLSLVSPLANLVVAPIVAPAMLVASVCLVAGLLVGLGAPALLAAPFALLGWVVLGAMVGVAGIFAAMPFASVELPPLVASALAGCLALGVLAATRRSGVSPSRGPDQPVPHARSAPAPPGRRGIVSLAWVAGLVTIVVGSAVLVRVAHRDARLVVTALDVGQGDSILVEGPRGGRLLLDGGPDPDRLLTVLDRHVPPWDRRIDLVILTHPHEDHVAGLALLLERYRVAGIAENGMLGSGPGDTAFRERLATMGITTSRLAAGDRLSFDGIRAEVRWPIAQDVPTRSPSDGRRVNDTSVVLDLRFGQRRVLLTGDIEDDVDPRLLAMGIASGDRPLDVLKVAHHGSGSATSDAWLDALRPRVALVSAGSGNRYGHPAPRTMRRLDARGVRVLRTDLDGDLEVSTDGRDLRLATSGGRPTSARPIPVPRATSIAQGLVLCAIPLAASRLAASEGPPPRPAQGRASGDDDPPPGPTAPTRGDPLAPCYDRTDGDPHAAGSGRTAALAPPGGWDPGALVRDRGGRGVPGAGRGSRGPPGRSGPRGERRAAA